MFVSKKFRKWAEEVMGVFVREEQERMYAERKAKTKAWREASGLAEMNRRDRERQRPLHEAVADPLEQAIVEYVDRRYANWREQRTALTLPPYNYSQSDAKRILPEPSLSIGDIVENMSAVLGSHGIDYRKERYSVVNSALRRLVKKGLLGTSSGVSKLARGRQKETRMYDPGER